MVSLYRFLATVIMATLLAGSSFSMALARHAASRGEEADVEATSELEREFTSGRQEASSRPGRGKHRSASRDVVPFAADPSLDAQRQAGGLGILHQAAASEAQNKNGCGAFLLI